MKNNLYYNTVCLFDILLLICLLGHWCKQCPLSALTWENNGHIDLNLGSALHRWQGVYCRGDQWSRFRWWGWRPCRARAFRDGLQWTWWEHWLLFIYNMYWAPKYVYCRAKHFYGARFCWFLYWCIVTVIQFCNKVFLEISIC